MTRTELIIQLLKVAIGLAFGAYFVWWSLEVLDRLTPENEAPTPAVGRIFMANASINYVIAAKGRAHRQRRSVQPK
jgi:hypothetical protein